MRRDLREFLNLCGGLTLPVLSISLGGCNIDNQSLAKGDLWKVVNPDPVSTNFAAQNAKHKVVLAVIDSGVDYNHPTLQKNIHFQLDADGKPTGIGRDFVAGDGWSYPTIARTAIIDPSVDTEGKKKALNNSMAIFRLLALEPSLQPFLSYRRVAWQEVGGGAYHGTHVSGLMTYDRPDFGLLAYRVIPSVERNDPEFDYTTESFQMITDAINQAAADGARVVNMSLGMDFSRAVPGDESAASVASVDKLLKLSKMVEDAIKSHPEVLYISAAGNDG
ncbi:MAG: S8 family serine peptidase, partial [Bdellovibrionota bacterium]